MKSLSRVRLFATPWTVAYQAPLSMEFPRQEYWSGLPLPWGYFPCYFTSFFFFHKKSFPCLVILSLSFVLTPVPPQFTLLPSTPRARPFSPPPGFLSQLPTTSPTPNLPPRQGPKGEKHSQVKGPSARAEEAFSVMEERDDSEH